MKSSEGEPYRLGIHFSQNRIGYLFKSGEIKVCKIEALTVENFQEKVEQDYKIKLV